MSSEWPKEVGDFRLFLDSLGLHCVKSIVDGVNFGNHLLVYASGELIVQVVSDRDLWFARVAESDYPRQWYNPEMLAEMLDGREPTAMTLSEQLLFLEAKLATLRDLFRSGAADQTRARLKLLGAKRASKLDL